MSSILCECIIFLPTALTCQSGDATLSQENKPRSVSFAQIGSSDLVHAASVTALAFTRDGKRLVSAGGDGRVIYWDVASGQKTALLDYYDYPIAGLCLSPTTSHFAFGNVEKQIVVWDIVNDTLIAKFRQLKGDFKNCNYATSGDQLLITTTKKLYLWDLTNLRAPVIAPIDQDANFVNANFINEDREILSLDDRGSLALWSRGDLKLLCSRPISKAACTCLTPLADSAIAVGGADGSITIWNYKHNRQEIQIRPHKNAVVDVCAFKVAKKRIIAALSSDGRVSITDLTSKKTNYIALKSGSGLAIAASPTGRMIAFSDANQIRLWDVGQNKEVHGGGIHLNPRSPVVYAKDHSYLITEYAGSLCKIDVSSGNIVAKRRVPTSITALALNEKRSVVASRSADGIEIYDTALSKQIGRVKDSDTFSSYLDFAEDGDHLFWKHENHDGIVYHLPSKQILTSEQTSLLRFRRTFDFPSFEVIQEIHGRADWVYWKPKRNPEVISEQIYLPYRMDISYPHNLLMVAGSTERERGGQSPQLLLKDLPKPSYYYLRFLSLLTHKPVFQIEKPSPFEFSSFRSSPDKSVLIGVDSAGDLACFELHGKQIRRTLLSPETSLRRYSFSPNSKYVIALSESKYKLYFWDLLQLHNQPTILKIPKSSFSISDFSTNPDGSIVRIRHEDGSISLWHNPLLGTSNNTKLTREELNSLWAQLASKDAKKAFHSMCRLVLSGEQAVTYINSRVTVVGTPSETSLKALLRGLDSNSYEIRTKTTQKTLELGHEALPALLALQKTEPPLEVRLRLKQIIEKIEQTEYSGELLRTLRAIEVLRHRGDEQATATLRKLSTGDSNSIVTRYAQLSFRVIQANLSSP